MSDFFTVAIAIFLLRLIFDLTYGKALKRRGEAEFKTYKQNSNLLVGAGILAAFAGVVETFS